MTETTDTAIHQTDTTDLRIPHGLFRTALGGAGAVVSGVRSDDTDSVALVATYLDNVLRFLEAHHEGEDALIWPRLRSRCPAAAEVLTTMEREHGAVHALRDNACSALQAWSDAPSALTARSLSAALSSLDAALESHFAEEEAEIIPLASRYMSPEEWGELPGHAMRHFTGDKMWLILGLVFEQMTDEYRAVVLEHMPPPVVEMWTNTGRAAFDDAMGRIRRIAG
jgi:hemerythrin-like domain-containing protein